MEPTNREVVFRVRVMHDMRAKLCAGYPFGGEALRNSLVRCRPGVTRGVQCAVSRFRRTRTVGLRMGGRDVLGVLCGQLRGLDFGMRKRVLRTRTVQDKPEECRPWCPTGARARPSCLRLRS
jgi:hypothetical protein